MKLKQGLLISNNGRVAILVSEIVGIENFDDSSGDTFVYLRGRSDRVLIEEPVFDVVEAWQTALEGKRKKPAAFDVEDDGPKLLTGFGLPPTLLAKLNGARWYTVDDAMKAGSGELFAVLGRDYFLGFIRIMDSTGIRL